MYSWEKKVNMKAKLASNKAKWANRMGMMVNKRVRLENSLGN